MGPPHCHACEIGTPVEWADCVTVAEVGAKALRDAAEAYGHYAQANGAEIVNWLRRRAARATTTAEVGTDGEL
ncbi:hypothetical protein [Aeromicrobium sp. UC242_57]|uniref:hypothetical protein n=1 Tax=Aeromicrobium sp. UC242_57 TaxID=3374624 RepID=UPI0037B16D42